MFLATLKKHKKLFASLFMVLMFTSFAPVFTKTVRADGPGSVLTPEQRAAAVANTPKISICSLPGASTVCNVFATIIMIPLAVSSAFLWVAGLLLDEVIKFTIVNVSSNIGAISGINIAWSVIRDLVNISFIFILLYTAIMVILDRGADMKKTITGIVIAAILINFSLFFAKVIVDTSNIVALTVENSIVTSCAGGTAKDPSSLSKCFMQPLGLATIWKPGSNGETILEKLDGDFFQLAIISIFGSIFILITTFVFLAAGIMFIIRFVTIIILLILSPIAVIGTFLPSLGKSHDDWWKSMTEQAIFAPLFMVMTWITLTVVSSSTFETGRSVFAGGAVTSAGLGSLFTGQGSSIIMVVNFIIVIALVVATLTISKKYSSKGGAMGSKFAGKIVGGTVGWAGRNTIGRGAEAITNSKALNSMASSRSSFVRNIGQATKRTTNSTAEKSFTARGTALGKMLGAEPGNTAGYRTRIEKTEKQSREAGERVRQIEAEEAIAAGLPMAAKRASGATLNTAEEALEQAMEKAVSQMTNKEIESFAEANKRMFDNPEFAKLISVQQLEAIDKSDKFSEAEKARLKNTRFAKAISGDRDAIRGLSDKELEMIDPAALTSEGFVSQLKESQVDSITKNNKFTSSQKSTIKTRRGSSNTEAVGLDPSKIASMDVKDIAKIDMRVLASMDLLSHLNIKKLKRLRDELTDAQAQDIRDSLLSHAALPMGVALSATQIAQRDAMRTWLQTGKGAPGAEDAF